MTTSNSFTLTSDSFAPESYVGLQNFHKYWGKKPADLMRLLLHTLTDPGDTVLDPFVGYGSIARECAVTGRRFIGIDINPTAIRLTTLLSDPPSLNSLEEEFITLKRNCQNLIDQTYLLPDGITIATHYLWDGDNLKEIWSRGAGRSKAVHSPTIFDRTLVEAYKNYESQYVRDMKFFQNSRINSQSSLSLTDLFSGRALFNIDNLIAHIRTVTSQKMRDSLMLCLTSSIGQMSQMVFAISHRGKRSGTTSSRIEVGSWAIGFWRPHLHFEINVWNCFARRTNRLIKALGSNNATLFDSTDTFAPDLRLNDCIKELKTIDESTVDLIITDPPHGDRIPYLELSEIWNAVHNDTVHFEDEIVISNARERGKDSSDYASRMSIAMSELLRVLQPHGIIVLLFNSRKNTDWSTISNLATSEAHDKYSAEYLGCFDCQYSVGSIVQDNRSGGLRSDFGLVFRKKGSTKMSTTTAAEARISKLQQLPGWSTSWPRESTIG